MLQLMLCPGIHTCIELHTLSWWCCICPVSAKQNHGPGFECRLVPPGILPAGLAKSSPGFYFKRESRCVTSPPIKSNHPGSVPLHSYAFYKDVIVVLIVFYRTCYCIIGTAAASLKSRGRFTRGSRSGSELLIMIGKIQYYSLGAWSKFTTPCLLWI